MVTAVEKKTKAALARQVKRRTCVLVIIPYYENNVDFIKCLVTAVAFVVAAGACVYVLNKAVSLSVFISMLFSYSPFHMSGLDIITRTHIKMKEIYRK